MKGGVKVNNFIALGAANSPALLLGWVVLVMAFVYLFLIKPQKKQQQAREKMLSELKINDKIVTAGGITGYIRSKTDQFLYVEISDGLVVEITRFAVAEVLESSDDATEENDEAEAEVEADEEAQEKE